MRILVTGGAGFYGHHFVDYILRNTDWDVVVLDRIDESSSGDRLHELKSWKTSRNRVKFVHHDLRSAINPLLSQQMGHVDYIFHLAAASHVDRSIADPMGFVMDNVVGTCNILEYARTIDLKRFIYFSTDEVFGSTEQGKFSEWDRYKSGSPYAATKAGGEELVLAYQNTYGVPAIITHCMNIFGTRQHPEKFIPKVISHALKGEIIPIHTSNDGTLPCKRSFIHVDFVSQALMFVLDKGAVGDKYNITNNLEFDVKELARLIVGRVDKTQDLTRLFRTTKARDVRPGNDFAYGIDGSKLKEMGFNDYVPRKTVLKQIQDTVDWYLKNRQWLNLS